MKKFLMLHGINHNMFGKREPKFYGTITLDQINESLSALGRELGVAVQHFQTNSEGALVDRIHQAYMDKVDGVVINAGAWTHYSYGMRDALAILTCPIVEIHMSNNHARDKFRQHSVISDIAKGYIAGFGQDSYLLGLRAAVSAANTAPHQLKKTLHKLDFSVVLESWRLLLQGGLVRLSLALAGMTLAVLIGVAG